MTPFEIRNGHILLRIYFIKNNITIDAERLGVVIPNLSAINVVVS